MHARLDLMRQVHEPEIEAKVHYFVTILEHKVKTRISIKFIHHINKLVVFVRCDK